MTELPQANWNKLAQRAADLRQQRDEARRERDASRKQCLFLTNALREARQERDQARREVEELRELLSTQESVKRALDRAEPWVKLVGELTAERDEARARAVAATTEADDLRARVEGVCSLAEALHDFGTVQIVDVRAALEGATRTKTWPVTPGSPKTDTGRSPDLLGPQIGDSA